MDISNSVQEKFRRRAEGRGLVENTGGRGWLDRVVLEVFSNRGDSVCFDAFAFVSSKVYCD